MVRARPILSPKMPKMMPPVAQPMSISDVAMPEYLATSGASVAMPFSAATAGLRTTLKSCCPMVSKTQPSVQTVNTNH